MAFLDDVFGKKDEASTARPEPSQSAPSGQVFSPQQGFQPGIPVEQVLTMRQQGMNHNQIVESLQRAGWPIDQINNALSQAEMKENVETPVAGTQQGTQQEMQPGQIPPGGENMQQQEYSQNYQQEYAQDYGQDSDVQAIVEQVIQEKWKDLSETVNAISTWKDETQSTIDKMGQQIENLQHSFDKLHEGVLGKIQDYDKGVKEVGIEIKALEKVFQKILPNFVENVNELSRITRDMKKREVKKK